MVDNERTREEIEAENERLRRELEKYRRAEQLYAEMERARPAAHPHGWMRM